MKVDLTDEEITEILFSIGKNKKSLEKSYRSSDRFKNEKYRRRYKESIERNFQMMVDIELKLREARK